MKPHQTLVCQWLADMDCMAFCTWEKANFLCEIHAKQIVCIKKHVNLHIKIDCIFINTEKNSGFADFFS